MIIPWEQLEKELLHNIIESFVLREGSDYGLYERSLNHKVNDVMEQLKQGVVVIVWSELHSSVNIINKDKLDCNSID